MQRAIVMALFLAACEGPHPPPRPDCVPTAAPDPTKGEVLRRDCEGGDPGACERLAAMYRLGAGIEEKPDEARDLLKRAMKLWTVACGRGDQKACERLPEGVAALPLDLPGPDDDEEDATVAIEIAPSGEITIDGTKVTGPLAPAVATRCSGDRVVIAADKSVPHARVIALLDALRAAGCSKIVFGVTPLGGSEATHQP